MTIAPLLIKYSETIFIYKNSLLANDTPEPNLSLRK